MSNFLFVFLQPIYRRGRFLKSRSLCRGMTFFLTILFLWLCIHAVCMKCVSRAHHPCGCGARMAAFLALAAQGTSTRRCRASASEEAAPTGPRRRRRRTRRTCGWTSASPTHQASPPTWMDGTTRSSLVGHVLRPRSLKTQSALHRVELSVSFAIVTALF